MARGLMPVPINRLMAPWLTPQSPYQVGEPSGAQPATDPNMVVQPQVDPGYGLHNTPVGNLNQTPGIASGWLPAGAQMTPQQQAAWLQYLQQTRGT